MTTHASSRQGAFRRLMNKVVKWSEALEYSSVDYTFDRIAFVERELADLRDRMRQLEASPHEAPSANVIRPAPE